MQKQEAETLTTNNPNDSPQTPELSGTENEAIVTDIPENDGTEGPESALPEHTEDTDEGQKDPVEEEDKTGEEKDNEETKDDKGQEPGTLKGTKKPKKRTRKRKKLLTLRHIRNAFLILVGLMLITCGALYIYLKPLYIKAQEQVYDIIADMDTGSFRRQTNTMVYDKDGGLIGKLGYEHYEYKDITDISDYIQQGYIDVEDRNFKSHIGIDPKALLRAAFSYVKNRGHITQGGSTITQQVIKNNLLTQERTFTRKALEILIAIQLEKEFTKAQIMEFYANSCYYGNSCYGVEAAAQYYFGVDANSVTLSQAAIIVGTSNAPNRLNPVADYEAAMEKKERVLSQMLAQGHITEEQYAEAVADRPEIVRKTDNTDNESYLVSYAVYCSALKLIERDKFEFKYTFKSEDEYKEYRELYSDAYQKATDDVRDGGYRIYTSFDMHAQELLQDAVDETLKDEKAVQEDGRYDMQAAAVCIDNKTGQVIAVVGGRGTDDEYNRAYLAKRQAGSSIKPLVVYGPALNEGAITPSSVYVDEEIDINGYAPKNSNGEYLGEMTVREALARSVNTIAAQIFTDTGSQTALSYLEKMKFTSLSFGDAYNTAVALGGFTNGVTPSDMARGYASIANGGEMRDSTCILTLVSEADGTVYDASLSKPERIFSKDTSFMLQDMMQGVFKEEYGTAHDYQHDGMVLAGKTGTTNSNRDAWFAGFTTEYTMVTWTGCDMPKSNDNLVGNGYPAQIWDRFMQKIHEGKQAGPFNMPDTMLLEDAEGQTVTADRSKNRYEDRPEGWEYTSGSLRDKIAEFERKKRIETQKANAEEAVSEFEAFTISSTDDVDDFDPAYQHVLRVIGRIEDDFEQTAFKERAEYKYSLLSGEVMDKWQKAIEAENAAAQEQTNIENQKAAAQSGEDALNSIRVYRINAVNAYIDALNSRTVYTSDVENLITSANLALQYCTSYSEYADLSSALSSAITHARAQRTEAQVRADAKAAEEAQIAAEKAARDSAAADSSTRSSAEQAGRREASGSSGTSGNSGSSTDQSLQDLINSALEG